MESWVESISWVKDNPENCSEIFIKANDHFRSSKKNGLILFDALDRVSDNWERYDLHGLLWQQLCNASGEGGDILRNYYREVMGIYPPKKDDYLTYSGLVLD